MRRQTATELQEACNAFNSVAPVGTKVRVCKGALHNPEATWIDTEVAAPGAYVMGGHTAVVKVPGDSIALTHVELVCLRERPIMDVTEILTRLVRLSDDEDAIGWASALATDVQQRGLAGDEDQSATLEACRQTRDVVAEVRELAKAARAALEAK